MDVHFYRDSPNEESAAPPHPLRTFPPRELHFNFSGPKSGRSAPHIHVRKGGIGSGSEQCFPSSAAGFLVTAVRVGRAGQIFFFRSFRESDHLTFYLRQQHLFWGLHPATTSSPSTQKRFNVQLVVVLKNNLDHTSCTTLSRLERSHGARLQTSEDDPGPPALPLLRMRRRARAVAVPGLQP